MPRRLRLLIVCSVIFFGACSNLQQTPFSEVAVAPTEPLGLTLPVDGVQPWERTDARGLVRPSRQTAALSPTSEVVSGVERFLDQGATESGEALTLAAGAGTLGAAIYRLPLSGQPIGTLAVDVNPAPGNSYYIGVSDYAAGAWEWHGPYIDGQVALSLTGDYLSALGNLFVAVVVHEGWADVVSVAATPLDVSDTVAPPAPSAPQLTSAQGGLAVEWEAVAAPDLAGYRIYYSYSPFTADTDAGVQSVDLLEGTTQLLLPALRRLVWVAVGAVDFAGNAALSPVVSGLAGGGKQEALNVKVSAPSVLRNEPVALLVNGPGLYDLDLDGDGVWDLVGVTEDEYALDSSTTGLLRPRVRATSGSLVIAQGGLSVLVSGGGRPVALATATPQTGIAPLDVSINGSGSQDFEGTVEEYALDFDGDGIFEVLSTDGTTEWDHMFFVAGVYNVKLRVTDNDGLWDVDTVSILVTPPPAVTLLATPPVAQPGERVDLGVEMEGQFGQCKWDFDGDLNYEFSTSTLTAHTSFAEPGEHIVSVEVELITGGTATASVTVYVRGFELRHAEPGGGGNTRLLMVLGLPAMFYDTPGVGTSQIFYTRALDPAGAAWDAPVMLTDASSGAGFSAAIVAGRPALAFTQFDGSAYQPAFLRALDAEGTSWPAIGVVADGTDQSVLDVDLEVVAGNPAIVYTPLSTLGVRYMRAADLTGSLWDPSIYADPDSDAGYGLSLEVITGHPAFVSGSVSGNNVVYYRRATDPTGASWTGSNISASGTDVTLRELNGKPFVLVGGSGFPYLFAARANDAAGSSWPSGQQLPSVGNIENASMDLVNGLPCVCYMDGATISLIRATNAGATTWTNPQQIFYAGNSVTGQFDVTDLAGRPALGFNVTGSLVNHIFGVVY